MGKRFISILLSLAMMAGATATVSVSAEDNATKSKNDTTVTVDANKFGDADSNNKINVKDTTYIQKYLNKSVSTIDQTYADVNEDGAVDVKDATIIQKYVTKKINNFPAKADNDWRTSSVGYEIFVRSFYDHDGDGCGDFLGVVDKIDYLKSLGVNVVWLMPFNPSPSYHGYDITDYNSVCEDYGTMEDFNTMLKALHDNGIKVIMDLVVNHTSNQHPWFKDSNKTVPGKYKDYYVWTGGSAITTVTKQMWKWSATRREYYYYCFNGNMPDLNYENKEVWSEVDSISDFWLDKGIDGFRLDAALHIDDTINGNKKHVDEKEGSLSHEWWQHFENHVKEKNPNAMCIGEVWAETSMESTQAKFFGDLDSNFDFYNMSEIKSMVKGTPKNIAKSSQSYNEKIFNWSNQTPDVNKVTINSTMLSNHDVDRIGYDVYTKYTDQNVAFERLKLAATVQMTTKGMPWIYYGDEIGQNGGGKNGSSDPNRREAMDWFKGRTGTGATKMNALRSWSSTEKFTKADDGISVEEQENVEGSILEHYKKLVQIRNKYKIFYTGDYSTAVIKDSLYGYKVTDDCRDYSMFVIHNNKSDDVTFKANYDFTDELSGKTYKAGDTVTLSKVSSMIIRYTGEEVPLSAE